MENKGIAAVDSCTDQEQTIPPWLIPHGDPNAPKRNMGAYILYYNSVQEQIRRDNPDMLADEFMKHVSESYGTISATEKEEWDVKAKADQTRYLSEVSAYVPPPGYDDKGVLIVVEPTHKNGRKVSKREQERDMKSVIDQSNVAVTEEHRNLEVSFFPRNNGKPAQDEGEIFSEWTGLFDYPRSDDRDTFLKCEWMKDNLYDGYRSILEPILRKDWERTASDFKQIPKTAKWSVQRVQPVEGMKGSLMPVLQDENHVFLLCPTSAECVSRTGELAMPTPYTDRDARAGAGHYMNYDVWFEDCGDGGVYVLGLDEQVLLFYVDGPGDMVYNRWQCHKDQWESMWLSAFGNTTIQIDKSH